MSWDFDKKDESQKKNNYTKFPTGVTRIRVLDAEPHVRWVHWMPQFSRSVNCPGKGCPIDEIRRQQKANGEQPSYSMSRRMAMNIYNYETQQVEIMEQGVGFFQDLRDIMTDLKEEGKELSDAVLKVRRRGTGKDDTSYRIDKDIVSPIEDDVKVKVASDRADLNEFFKPHTPDQILRLLQVTENHAEAWVEIMSNTSTEPTEQTGQEEEIEIR